MRSLAVFILLSLFVSCTSPGTSPEKPVTYESLAQFRQPLQSHLQEIVAENSLYSGIMWEAPKTASSIGYVYNETSISDLIKISKSEHAILRTLANDILMEKPGIDHFSYLKNHLNDTAKCLVFDHEMGLWFTNPSDWMLELHDRDTSISQQQHKEITNLMITDHPYLRSAYTALFHLPTQKKYYATIRKMAESKRDNVDEQQFALYALSKFHRTDDVAFIKRKLTDGYMAPFTAPIFFLIIDNPDTAYFPALLKFFYRTKFSNCQPDIRYSFSDCFTLLANAIATYQTPEAASLLSFMLTDPRFGECHKGQRVEAAFAIINNSCPAFEKLVPQAIKMIHENEGDLNTLEKIRTEATTRKPVPPPGKDYYAETRGWW